MSSVTKLVTNFVSDSQHNLMGLPFLPPKWPKSDQIEARQMSIFQDISQVVEIIGKKTL